MNPFAYAITGMAVKALSALSKTAVHIHGRENIPSGAVIFAVNHFTRFETLLLPYHIHHLIDRPVWSLADYNLFQGPLGNFLNSVGAVSTKNPHRDLLIIKSLLSGKAVWIIFPEGRMVKSKKIMDKGRFMVASGDGKHRPHTGAAGLALRAEFYRQRIKKTALSAPEEAERLTGLFQTDLESVSELPISIVPVNMTYFPIRAKENALSIMATYLSQDISQRALEEIMAEGTLLLSETDIDIRFGKPIEMTPFLNHRLIKADIETENKIDFNDAIRSIKVMKKKAREIMHRYMSDIYNMTTINYDHIFASLLQMMPKGKIDERGLKERAFLAATVGLNQEGIHRHDGFLLNQSHLLTDDRYNRYHDFISTALEKKIVVREGKKLVKTLSHRPAGFHTIRIDNPIQVMANEVEPLQPLQRYIRRLVRMPGCMVRKKIASFLITKARSDYENDYRRFFKQGVTKPKSIGMPFLIKGGKKDIGLLLIHGYMAAPEEVKASAAYLGRKKIWVYAPRIKGHGTSPEDLATRTYQDWIDSVDEGYGIIKSLCKRVVVAGFSTGAGLALHLAARASRLDGICAVCPPLKLQDFQAKFVPAVDIWNRLMGKVNLDGAKKEFVENHPENPHINYLKNPISGIKSLEELMSQVEAGLPSVTVPALVIQSSQDPVVDPAGSKKVFDLLGSRDKKYLLIHSDRHGIINGEGACRVHQAIYDFIADLRIR